MRFFQGSVQRGPAMTMVRASVGPWRVAITISCFYGRKSTLNLWELLSLQSALVCTIISIWPLRKRKMFNALFVSKSKIHSPFATWTH